MFSIFTYVMSRVTHSPSEPGLPMVQRAAHRFLGHTEDVAGRSPFYHLSNEWG